MQYTVFGQVIKGLDIIDTIGAVPTKPGDMPVEPVIMNITLLEN
jgi:cyclophilin family peptidyl-prolyl cis-trans isomerase